MCSHPTEFLCQIGTKFTRRGADLIHELLAPVDQRDHVGKIAAAKKVAASAAVERFELGREQK